MRYTKRNNRSRPRRSRFPDLQNTPITTIRRIINGTASGSESTNYTWSQVSTYLDQRPSRISSIDVEAISAGAGNIAIVVFGATGDIVTETRQLKVGTIPVRFKVKVPKSTDFNIPTDGASAIQVAGSCNFTLIVNCAARE